MPTPAEVKHCCLSRRRSGGCRRRYLQVMTADPTDYPRLISFSGVDGSGKSTQIALLSAALERSGESVTKRWYRPGYSARLDRVRRWIRSARPSAIPPADPTASARIELFENPRVQFIWVVVALVDTWIEFVVTTRLALARYDRVIYDRHLADAELDLYLNFPKQSRVVAAGIALVRAMMRAPERMLLLQLPLEHSETRRTLKEEPFPETRQEAQERFRGYSPELARWRSSLIIDASQPEAKVAADVADAVGANPPDASSG